MRTTILKILFVPALLMVFSCGKTDYVPGASSQGKGIKDKHTQAKMQEMAKNLPDLAFYNSTMDKVITISAGQEKMGFSFSDPVDGWNFGSSSNITFTQNQNGGSVIFIGSPTSGGGGNAGGTVVAGNTTLDIAYSFCFTVDEEALGVDFTGLDTDLDGVSGVIGISGDFDALLNGDIDEDADVTDYFYGYAMYYVYDDEANGSYDILNWFDDVNEDPDDLADHGFSFVFDFQEFDIYFSSEGSMNVSGGDMSFNGSYFGLIGFFEALIDGDDPSDASFQEVEGFGQMGCD